MIVKLKFIQGLNKQNSIINKQNPLYSDNLKRILFLLYIIIQAKEKILFVASDTKYYKLLKKVNLLTFQPFFVGKWIGGYLTNFDKINKGKNIDNKNEGLLCHLMPEKNFSCLVILDPKNSLIAIQEAILLNIPIICFLDNNSFSEKNEIELLYKKNYPSYASYFFPVSIKRKNEKFVDEYDSLEHFYPILNSIVKTILYCYKQLKN